MWKRTLCAELVDEPHGALLEAFPPRFFPPHQARPLFHRLGHTSPKSPPSVLAPLVGPRCVGRVDAKLGDLVREAERRVARLAGVVEDSCKIVSGRRGEIEGVGVQRLLVRVEVAREHVQRRGERSEVWGGSGLKGAMVQSG